MIDPPSPALIGVVHLPPLPGAVASGPTMDEIIERALTDARALAEAGFDGLIVENFGDVPFSGDHVEPGTVAAMAMVVDQVRRATRLAVGVNVLRNDARAALGIAAASAASFIRVNVHCGVYATDQGILEGRAHQTLTYRKQLGRRIAILADVHVKHAVCLSEPDLARAAKDTAYRGLADALVVTGPATGEPVTEADLERVRSAVPDRRLFVGSGATAASIAKLLKWADGVIVGTAIKVNGVVTDPIDPARAAAFVRAAGRQR
jgi:hypothetical protein